MKAARSANLSARDLPVTIWLIALCGLFLFSFFLRFPYPSPSWWHVDERAFILHPLGLWSGDLNPHFFNYPTLPFYLSSLLYYVYYLLSYSGSQLHFVAERYFVGGHDLIVLSRSFNSLQSALTGVVCALVGRQLYGARVGLLVGFSFAVLPLSVRFAHLATVDTGQVLWQVVSLYCVLRLLWSGRWHFALLAGASAGMATACKYPGVLSVLPLAVACGLSVGSWQERVRFVVIAGVGAGLAFFCASPYVLLDFSSAWVSLSSMGSEHLLSGSHEGEAFSLWHHLRYNLRYGVGLLGVLALVFGLSYRPSCYRSVDWVVLSAVLAQVFFLSLSSSVFMRYALPLAPLVVLAWGRLLWCLPKGSWISWAVAALLCAEPLYSSLHTRALLSGEDTRDLARAWIENNVPEATWVVELSTTQAGPQLLSPAEIFAREYQFTESYDRATLTAAYAWLMRQDGLPVLYLKVSPSRANQVVVRDGGAGVAKAVLIDCVHPLCGGLDEVATQLYKRAQWRQEWHLAIDSTAVFDAVDWYFLPIGGYGSVQYSGPSLRLGFIALEQAHRAGGTADFFALMHGLIELEQHIADGDWPAGRERSRELSGNPLLGSEVLSRAHLYRFFYYAGLSSFKERQFAAAVGYWRQAARIEVADLVSETRAQMLVGLGLAHVQLQEFEPALDAWRLAAELDPQNAQVRYYMGRIILDNFHHASSALVAGEAALDIAPDYVDALLLRGEALAVLGRRDEALEAYHRARELAPENERLEDLINALQD
jgi:tetratricopeptide (TPR) repeat protein/4-amino-4-deoxy-L-arabinose transferase-like glycosyltransferase